METGLTLLAHASMPLPYWLEAFRTSAFFINLMPSKVIKNDSPLHRLFGTNPNYAFLKSFGCLCFPCLRSYNSHKLEFRSVPCVFIGYSPNHKGYKCLDSHTGRVYISRHVWFDEMVFPFKNAQVDGPPILRS